MYRPRTFARALLITACAGGAQAAVNDLQLFEPHGSQFCPQCYFGKDAVSCAERHLHFAAQCPLLRPLGSNAIAANAQPIRTISLASRQRSVGVSGLLSVSWTTSLANARDRVLLFKTGSDNSEPLWQMPTGGARTGNAVFNAPEQTGSYEFRYLDAGGLVAAQSAPITVASLAVVIDAAVSASVDGMLSVQWSASAGRSAMDWVGLHRVGEPTERVYWHHATFGAASGTFRLCPPDRSGNYEFRYFSSQSDERIAQSNALAIGPTAKSAVVVAARDE